MRKFLKKLYNYGNDCTLGLGKELILGLIIIFVGLISFGHCEKVSNLLDLVQEGTFSIEPGTQTLATISSDDYGVYCITVNSFYPEDLSYSYIKFGYSPNQGSLSDPGAYLFLFNLGYYNEENPSTTACMRVNQPYLLVSNVFAEEITIGYKLYRLDVLLNTDIPVMSSSDCQSEYSLMPIDSCNSEYCELNDLCSTIGGSGSSTLYVNDVRHESAPFIYVNIPEEFKRDYLTGVNEFTINVEGLNGDQDYINGIIDVNSYRPSSEDFTQTFVGGLTLIFPYIIITAVILFIWRFIRKIFK